MLTPLNFSCMANLFLQTKALDRDARMEEMRLMLKQRNGRSTPSGGQEEPTVPNLSGLVSLDESARTLENLVADADQSLTSSLDRRQDLESGVARMIDKYKAVR
jgi:hypothetical protein